MFPYLIVKRLIDITASAVLLIALLPIICVLAVLIRIESPGSPVFYQTRVGRGGAHFTILKLRSMRKDAPRSGPEYTLDNDPRITRLGRFIRATSLDELPQLWNVLIGDMSLIGPRPATPSQEAQYAPADWQKRHSIRPGITGLAQVRGRSSLTTEQQIAYDCAYVDDVSLRMDTAVVGKTIIQLLFKGGSN